MPSSFKGINHLKLPCQSINVTHDFYVNVFPFTPLPQYDHFTPNHELFAKMFTHAATQLIVEVRYCPNEAAAQKGWDPITYGVGTRKDLEDWAEWLDAYEVKRSRIFTGIKGWLMACEDPDRRIVRLYVEDEEHEWTDHPDVDAYWLGAVRGDPNAKQSAS